MQFRLFIISVNCTINEIAHSLVPLLFKKLLLNLHKVLRAATEYFI
jgi:hypothetical protein